MALVCHERSELVGMDELVLGPVDELNETAEPPVRVVHERQAGTDVFEQKHLGDAVEHVWVRRQRGIRGVLCQDPLAEAVEVADGHSGPCLRAHHGIQSLLEFACRLHVVGKDEQVLREQSVMVVEQVLDPLDDHLGLAGPGAGDNDDRPVAPLNDAPLIRRQLVGKP